MEEPVQFLSPEEKKKQNRQLLAFFLFLAATVAISFWMLIGQVWPANKFLKWQAEWFNGEYYPKLTFAVIWIIVLLSFVFAASLFSWAMGKIKGKK